MYVCMPRLSSLLQGSTALLRARLVHVRVTEYDRATSNDLEPLHAKKVARAVERQLKLIAARSLLKAASDLVPSCSATDSGPVEGKLGRCVVAVGDSGSSGYVELVDLAGVKPFCGALGLPRTARSHNPTQWNMPRTHLIVGVTALSWTPFCCKRVESSKRPPSCVECW